MDEINLLAVIFNLSSFLIRENDFPGSTRLGRLCGFARRIQCFFIRDSRNLKLAVSAVASFGVKEDGPTKSKMLRSGSR